MSLEIKKINKKYGDQVALIDVSFSLKKGDIVGFLGPNGAGKTTLMKIITSILKPDSGNITINGYDTQKNEVSTKRQIGYLAENNPLYKDMLVTEYLDFIASLYEIENKKDKVKEIIKKTGLEGEIKKKIEELSKGYKQRVGIAAALVHDPNVLILDEPTTGLDPNQLIEIRKLIRVQRPHGSNFEIRSARYSDLKHKRSRNLRITNAQILPMILVDLPRAGWWLGFFWLRNFHPLVVSFKYLCFDLCFDCGQNSQPSLKESCGAVHSPFRSYKSEAY